MKSKDTAKTIYKYYCLSTGTGQCDRCWRKVGWGEDKVGGIYKTKSSRILCKPCLYFLEYNDVAFAMGCEATDK